MKRVQLLLLAGVALIVLAVLGVFVFNRLEPYQKTLEHGYAPEAKRNPYLAAELFLKERGVSVTERQNLAELDQLPSRGQVLLLLINREQMTPQQNQRLLKWVQNGGHLIVIAQRLWDKKNQQSGDWLLDQLGVQQWLSTDLDPDEPAKPSSCPVPQSPSKLRGAKPSRTPENLYPKLTKLYLEDEQAPAYVEFDPQFHLYDSQNRAHAWANSQGATHMLQLNEGDGLVTVLTDDYLWRNYKIGRYDHAWLLWYLTQDSAVTVLYRAGGADNLLTLLVRHYPAACVALLLLLALGLWRVGMRYGPLQADPQPVRRQLAEHLYASAVLLLQRSGQASLLASLQRDITRRARKRQPGFDRLPVTQQWQALSRLSQLNPSAISQAMRPPSEKRLSSAEFTHQVAHLQRLRNAL